MRRLLAVFTLALTVIFTGCGDDNPGDGDDDDDDDVTEPDSPTDDDGEDMDDDVPVEEEVCELLTPPASGTCEVTAGGDTKLLKGTVLTPTKVFIGGQVAVDAGGQITCVGCDCAAGGETVITCADGAISPGLINPHDHITYAQNSPYTDEGIRYEHRHQWRRGDGPGRPEITVESSATADEVRWGELRFIMGGATSIVGSGGQAGLARNLDRANLMEGLQNQKAVDFEVFPLDDTGGNRRTGDCNYGSAARTEASIANVDSFEPHTSEGIDGTARNEFLCQSSSTYDTMAPGVSHNLAVAKTAMIHAVGLQPADLSLMATSGTGLIWSPRSNITLYGDTARVTIAKRMGVEISLGTDWMPTGSMNLLRELRCASELNDTYYNHAFSDVDLWKMVTANAAAATATDDVIGTLASGKVADISIFAAHGKTYRAVIDAEPQDVVLVMRGGKVLYGDAGPVAALSTDCDEVDVCTTDKRVCLSSEISKTYSALSTGLPGIYPPFQCGTPMNEPSCTPERPMSVQGSTVYTGIPSAEDSDGDGIANANDKCPMVFDPIRPVDNGMQGDVDSDGAGDACDVCPLDANATTCSTADPNDRDNDGIANDTDNCADVSNADQADGDTDGKGDVCDACPAASNPGAAGCPASIYDIKDGTIAAGTVVRISNTLVTGEGPQGFFLQAKVGDTGYDGVNYSGIYVFAGTGSPILTQVAVGQRVTVDARVALFQGQLELDTVTAVTVDAAGPEAPPTPVIATYAQVKQGGTLAAQLEAVLVTLPGATVSSVDAAFGEFVVTSGADTLPVDDFLFLASPLPTVGQTYTALTGIVTLRTAGGGLSVMKLLPRSAADLAQGAPQILTFGPVMTFSRVGQSAAPTFPMPLTITLTGPAQGATVVTVTSGTPTSLSVMSVTVPDGQTSVVVPVTAITQAAAVTLTARIGTGAEHTSMVRVLGTTEAPTTVTLSPATATVAPSGTVALTATVDIPAPPAGTTITLATSAGMVPASVTIPANATSATFNFTDTVGTGIANVQATLGTSMSTSVVSVTAAAQHLVINEVDYDQEVNPDSVEIIEIFNPSSAAVSLTGKAILLINGGTTGATAALYNTIDLSSGTSVPAGGYVVIAPMAVTVPSGVIKIVPPSWTTDKIQNGEHDAMALVDTTAMSVIDTFAYEGDIVDFTPSGWASAIDFGTGTTVADGTVPSSSVCRVPNGTDTDVVGDWALCTTSTGLTNVAM